MKVIRVAIEGGEGSRCRKYPIKQGWACRKYILLGTPSAGQLGNNTFPHSLTTHIEKCETFIYIFSWTTLSYYIHIFRLARFLPCVICARYSFRLKMERKKTLTLTKVIFSAFERFFSKHLSHEHFFQNKTE